MDFHVRRAAAEDAQSILPHLRKLAIFFDSRRSLYGGEVEEKLLSMIESHFVRVAVEDGRIVGIIGGFVGPHFFNEELLALTEVFWWVAEEAASPPVVGLALMDEFIGWGRQNVDLVTFSLQEANPAGHHALLKRGFHLHERQYLLETA